MDIHVRIDGRDFPCRPTMGAMRRYRAMTGKEATSINWESPVDMTDYLYCCTASACRHDGVDFPYDAESFADALTVEDLAGWSQAVASDTPAEDGEKKKAESPLP